MRTFFMLLPLFFTVLSTTAVSQYTEIDYSHSGKVVVHSLDVELADSSTKVISRHTTSIDSSGVVNWSANEKNFDQWEALDRNDDGSVELTIPGLYEIVYYLPKALGFFKKELWRQQIYVPYPEPSNSEELAQKYAPLIQFNSEESFFPVSIEELIYHGENEEESIKVQTLNGTKYPRAGSELWTFLGYDGHVENRFDFGFEETVCDADSTLCDPLYLRDLVGNKSNPTVYWQASEEGKYLYLTYFMLYAFDPKDGDNLNPGNLGSHAFDRESFTITLEKAGGEYHPVDITYAGHGPDHSMNFLGCESIESCAEPAVDFLRSLRTFTGKTTVSWSFVNKVGSRPLVYIAKGSHAIYPSFGWYETFSANEKAGERGPENAVEPLLTKFDLTAYHPLTYSGYWVDGLAKFPDSKFPPFINRAPHAQWLASKDYAFDECFNNSLEDDCEDWEVQKYFNVDLAKDQVEIATEGSLQEVIALTGGDQEIILTGHGIQISIPAEATSGSHVLIESSSVKNNDYYLKISIPDDHVVNYGKLLTLTYLPSRDIDSELPASTLDATCNASDSHPNKILLANAALYFDELGLDNHRLPNISPIGVLAEGDSSVTLKRKQSSGLCSFYSESEISNQSNLSFIEPVLLINGYTQNGELGGDFDGGLDGITTTWKNLPKLLKDNDSGNVVPFVFRWATNSRFQDAASELKEAIEHIANLTGKEVHLVGHSFGGILARTYLQGLAAIGTSYEAKVASLTTVGTPHSGIYENSTYKNGIEFPLGWDALPGEFINYCGQISCLQAGSARIEDDGLEKLYGNLYQGEIVTLLLDSNNQFLAENLPIQQLIGLRETLILQPFPENPISSGNFSNGDGLISLKGQRFFPSFSNQQLLCGFTPLNFANVTITEHVLGISKHPEIYDYCKTDQPSVASILVGEKISDVARDFKGYGHTSFHFQGNKAHEVAVFSNTDHPTYQRIIAWIAQYPAEHLNKVDWKDESTFVGNWNFSGELLLFLSENKTVVFFDPVSMEVAYGVWSQSGSQQVTTMISHSSELIFGTLDLNSSDLLSGTFTPNNIDLGISYGVAKSLGLEDGLVAYYPFDGNANDASGNWNHGDIKGDTHFVSGVDGLAASFDGLGDYIELSKTLSIGSSSNTVAAWIKIPSEEVSRAGILLGNYGGSSSTINWELSNIAKPRIFHNEWEIDENFGPDLNDSKWHFVAWVRDKDLDQYIGYIDGQKFVISNSTGSDVEFSNVHRIGLDYRNTDIGQADFNGLIDELRIYDRALSQSEISELSNSLNKGLVAYYPFNGDATDASGNGNNGTEFGDTTYQSGIAGQAVSFDGSGDYVKLNSPLLNDNEQWSVTGWLYTRTEATDHNRHVIYGEYSPTENGDTKNLFIILEDNSNFGGGLIFDNFPNAGSPALQSGEISSQVWHPFAYVRDGDIISTYIGGNKVHEGPYELYFGQPTTVAAFGNRLATDSALYGQTNIEKYSMDGLLDEIRVYNRALSSSEIAKLANSLNEGLVAYFPFDGNADDKSGNLNQGDPKNGVAFSSKGKIGKAATFDGIDDYVNVSASDSLQNLSQVSIAGWVNVHDLSFKQRLVAHWTSGDSLGQSFIMSVNYDDETLGFAVNTEGSGVVQANTSSISANNWYHVTGVYDGAEVSIFLNGKKIESIAATGNIVNRTGDLYIGQGGSNSFPNNLLDGLLDEVKIYNRALSPSEISELANSLKEGLYAHYSFNDGNANDINKRNNAVGTVDIDYSSEIVGKAASFNGVSSYIDLPDQFFRTLTVAAYVQYDRDDIPPNDRGYKVSSVIDGWKDRENFALNVADQNGEKKFVAAFHDYDDTGNCYPEITVYSNTTVQQGREYHVAMTYDDSKTLSIYVNGNLEGQVTSNGSSYACSYSARPDIRLGVGRRNTGFFEGALDEVKIYNRALSLSEIAELANNLKDGLVAYYPFDGNANDASGNGLDADGYGNIDYSTGIYGQAVDLDGSGDYLVSPSISEPWSEWSFSVWVKPRNIEHSSHPYTIVEREIIGLYHDFEMFLHHSRDSVIVETDLTDNLESTTSPRDDIWTHIAVTYDGSKKSMYVNGALEDTVFDTNSQITVNRPLEIGRHANTGNRNYFNGLIDELRVHKRALLPSEIALLAGH